MTPTWPYPIQPISPHLTPPHPTSPHPCAKASQTLKTQRGWRSTRYCCGYGHWRKPHVTGLLHVPNIFRVLACEWSPHSASFGTTWIKLILKLVSKWSKPKALGALLRGGALNLFCQERSWKLRVLWHLESKGQSWSESIKRKLYIISIRTRPALSRNDNL